MTRRSASVGAACLGVAAAITRCADLGTRLFHHDESIHAWYSSQLARGFGYHYDPVFHGPLLYHLEANVFLVAGYGEVQARTVTAVFGVALVALIVFLLRHRLGDRAALLAGSLALVSPTLCYYARFNSHDMLIAVFTLVMAAAPFEFWRTGRQRHLMWGAMAAGLAISTKLNAYFVIVSLALYAVGFVLFCRVRGQPSGITAFLRARSRDVVAAAVLCASVVALLHVSTFVYYLGQSHSLAAAARGTLAAIFVAGFAHWAEMHRVQRLGGPFHFYLPLLVIYEPLVLAAGVAGLVSFMRRRVVFAAVSAAVLGVEWLALSIVPGAGSVLAAWLRMQPWHLLLASMCALSCAWTVVSLWIDGRPFVGCWVFLGLVQFLLYSYAGEKVPWLAVHVVLPWLIVAAVFMTDVWLAVPGVRGRLLLALAALALAAVSVHASWVLNTRNRSNVAEPMVQLEYGSDVGTAIKWAVDLAHRVTEPVVVRMEPAVQWPFAWYLERSRPAYGDRLTASETAPMLIAQNGPFDAVLETRYEKRPLVYSRWSWWIENVGRGDWRGLLRFTLYHDRWGREDSAGFIVWFRKDVAATIR